jgi:hypothetical protein
LLHPLLLNLDHEASWHPKCQNVNTTFFTSSFILN